MVPVVVVPVEEVVFVPVEEVNSCRCGSKKSSWSNAKTKLLAVTVPEECVL